MQTLSPPHHPDKSIVLVSASTSGDLVEKLISKKGFSPSAIATLYYLGRDTSKGHVLCDLQNRDDADGYPLIESYKPEECPYCKKHSIPTMILGDQFLTERPKVSQYSLTSQDAPEWLKNVLAELQCTDAFRVHKHNPSIGSINLSIDITNLLKNPSLTLFHAHLKQSLSKVVPASTTNVIHTSSEGALALAQMVYQHITTHNTNSPAKLINSADLQDLAAKLNAGTVVVVTDTLTDGRDLMAINRILRNSHGDGAVNYLVAIAACPSKKRIIGDPNQPYIQRCQRAGHLHVRTYSKLPHPKDNKLFALGA